MRQDDILAIMRAHDGPVSITEIIAESGRKATPTLRSNVSNRLRTMARQGIVQKVGKDEMSGRMYWRLV